MSARGRLPRSRRTPRASPTTTSSFGIVSAGESDGGSSVGRHRPSLEPHARTEAGPPTGDLLQLGAGYAHGFYLREGLNIDGHGVQIRAGHTFGYGLHLGLSGEYYFGDRTDTLALEAEGDTLLLGATVGADMKLAASASARLTATAGWRRSSISARLGGEGLPEEDVANAEATLVPALDRAGDAAFVAVGLDIVLLYGDRFYFAPGIRQSALVNSEFPMVTTISVAIGLVLDLTQDR